MEKDFTSEYIAAKKNIDNFATEIDKGEGKTKSEAIKAGYFRAWTAERIKKAFNFGNGTMKDFNEYTENNKKYCWIEIL